VTTPLVDRFHFAPRAGLTKTPILAEAPEPKAGDGGVVLLRLYDPIDRDGGPWGVSAREFAAVLDDLDEGVQAIELHISSPGGHVWDALAIMNALRQHPAQVVAVIDGIAASAASFVMLAADEIVAAQGAEVMVHSPMGVAIGNAEDMAKMAADLEHEAKNMAALYVAKAGGTVEQWLAVMAAETWYTAEEAVAAGLVDRVLDKATDSDAKARFDLSIFNYAGRAQAPAPTSTPTPIRASGRTSQEGAGMDPAKFREALGLKADVSDDDVLAAAAEYAQAAARLQQQAPDRPLLPEGHVALPEAALADLQASAAAGAAAAERLRVMDREQFLDAHRDRFAAVSREAWARQYDVDEEGTRKYLESAPVLVPTAEVGHASDAQASADDALFNEIMASRGLTPQGA
jgi:ATP-dependent protease ClpP protease subunit